ncbi:unnamed protein product [Phytophthora fragariaefolia]|uniref:Unnamed protein product n=1 Tax=Phytophthora fragariaefolia TaxID=1490495 RepID=A0A9W6XWW4_9STRA|nr:unnamed protein product [Phytophthora fragariaefolia]
MSSESKEKKRSGEEAIRCWRSCGTGHKRLQYPRLDTLKFDWGKLQGVAERALHWDSGDVINVNNDAVQLWTLGDNTMSLLVITLNKYDDADCLSKNVTQPDNSTLFESWHCKGAQMNKIAKCVVQEFDNSFEYNAAM